MSLRGVVAAAVLFAGGLGVMLGAYRRAEQEVLPVRATLLLPRAGTEGEPPGSALPVTVRFLPPASPAAHELARSLRPVGPSGERAADAFLFSQRPAVVVVPEFDEVFREEMLASGRLPAPGTDEALAGPEVTPSSHVPIEGSMPAVVGVLRDGGRPLARSWFLRRPPEGSPAFQPGPDVHLGYLAVRPAGQARNRTQGNAEGGGAGPAWTAVASAPRMPPRLYLAYLGGMVGLLTGGSALLVGLYWGLARRVTNRWLGPPLAALARHGRLLVGLHVAYFGLVVVVALVAFSVPVVRDFLGAAVQGQIQSGRGPLGAAGAAYGSGSIPLAAAVTVAINFLIGSLLFITLPSTVVPGVGVLLALFRAGLWGLLLAPTDLGMARAMIPHSGTLLLEGEGYILAAFFGLLLPLALLGREGTGNAGTRYVQALGLNLKGNLLVLLVLAVAALYEATEVILLMRG